MKKIFKNKWLWVIVIISLIGVWRWRVNVNKAKNGEKEKVVTVEKRDVVASIVLSGEIKAGKQATLNFPAPGKLAYVGVEEGDQVKRGQILMSLDLGDLQAAETKAYYAYLAADAYAKLIEDQVKNHDSDETFAQKNSRVSAQTARDSAYDTWLSAQRAVRNARLTAPFAGWVTNITTNVVGDTISLADGVTIVDPATMYFEAEIDELDLGRLTSNLKIMVVLDAYEGQEMAGVLDNIGLTSRLSSTGATVYPVKIKLLSDEVIKRLRLGMNGDAKIMLLEKKEVLAVPIDAVIDGKVFLKNGEATQVEVTTGLEGDEFVEITSGLSEGEEVIIK